MNWDFTSEDIIKGDADYSLRDFEKDLKDEVKLNFPDLNEKELNSVFNFIFAVCLCVALDYDIRDLLDEYETIKFELLEAIKYQNEENIDTIRAILQRAYLDFIDQGFTEKEAAAMLVRAIRFRRDNTKLR